MRASGRTGGSSTAPAVMSSAIEAHLHCMEAARAAGDLREVRGRQYPVPEGDLMRWQEQQRREAVERARRWLRTAEGSKAALERVFA